MRKKKDNKAIEWIYLVTSRAHTQHHTWRTVHSNNRRQTTHHAHTCGVTVDTHFYFLFTQGKHWTWFCVIAWQKELSVTSHPSHITFMFYTNAHTTRHTYNSIFAEFLHYIIHVYNLHRIYIFTYITYTRTTYTICGMCTMRKISYVSYKVQIHYWLTNIHVRMSNKKWFLFLYALMVVVSAECVSV